MWLFRLLTKMRFLRGTAFDLFSYLPERKEEQATLREYAAMLEHISAGLDAGNYEIAVELAQLPLEIRGFGHIKSANLAQAKIREAHLLKKFSGEVLAVTDVGRAA